MTVVYWIWWFVSVSLVIAYATSDRYKASNAVDRDITTCMRTDAIGLTSPYKTVWWKVDLGGVYNIHSVNILFENYDGYESRQRGRFAGFSLYVSNNGQKESLCYKDGPLLPPLDINITCNTAGRYVRFHNERRPGVTYPSGYELTTVYTELCEVIVYGCYKDGVFGNDCNAPCPGNCKTNTCHIQDGSCFGCKPGWTGATCNRECDYGSYGVDCNQHCPGECKNNLTCDHLTGLCYGGCAPGWNGSYCNRTACAVGWYGPGCIHQCSGHCEDNAVCNHVDGSCVGGCAAGWHGSNCSNECDECSNGFTCNQQTGDCNEGYTTDIDNSTKAPTKSLIIGGTVGGIIAVLIGVGVVVLAIWLRKQAGVKSTKGSCVVFENPVIIHSMEETSAQGFQTENADSQVFRMGHSTSTENIAAKNIKAKVENMCAGENSGFKCEYNDIPRGELHPCSMAKKQENTTKNRYITIFPYDHSRVVLKTSHGGNDYINANYIEDTKGKKAYIATQGPKPKTITDFWTMIWQEGISTIVCLTNLKEGVKNKCTQYWPSINDKLQAGDITVRNVEEKMYAENIIRKFKIYNNANEQDRPVTMYHYTTWADHGVADPLSLVVFNRQVMKATAQSTGKYTLVHCSAGVGRTGTYIALDALYREGQNTCKINVPMYVNTMRKDRMNMIQGEDQYRVLYMALMEAFCGPPKAVTKETFISKYHGKSSFHNDGKESQTVNLETEFEELLFLRKVYNQKDYVSGRVHLSANYTQSVLPLEEYMCHLSYKEGQNTYYNAVLLQTFLQNDSLISAQYPLPEYTEDFLRLIRDFNARIIVFLCAIKDIKSSTRWFPKKGNSIHVGNFTLKHLSSKSSPHVTKTNLVLQNKGSNDMGIAVFECPSWNSGQLTVDKRILLDVINEVKTEKTYQEGRIIILSSDGATRCGPFCAVYNALEQITTDGEVDLFTIARQLKVRRPEILSTLVEYQLCYDTVAEYLLNDSVYGNC